MNKEQIIEWVQDIPTRYPSSGALFGLLLGLSVAGVAALLSRKKTSPVAKSLPVVRDPIAERVVKKVPDTPEDAIRKLFSQALSAGHTAWSLGQPPILDPNKAGQVAAAAQAVLQTLDIASKDNTSIWFHCRRPGSERLSLKVTMCASKVTGAWCQIGAEGVSDAFRGEEDALLREGVQRLYDDKKRAIADARLSAIADNRDVKEAVYAANFPPMLPNIVIPPLNILVPPLSLVPSDSRSDEEKKFGDRVFGIAKALLVQPNRFSMYKGSSSIHDRAHSNKMTDGFDLWFVVNGPNDAEFWLKGVSCMPLLSPEQRSELIRLCMKCLAESRDRRDYIETVLDQYQWVGQVTKV